MVSVNYSLKHLRSANHGGHSTALASKAYASFGSVLLPGKLGSGSRTREPLVRMATQRLLG